LRHADAGNHGAGKSRNIGITNAKFEYISFLDADDFFLENRFFTTKKVFADSPSIDGVYEAVGYYYENSKMQNNSEIKLNTMSEIIPPEQLFEKQAPIGNSGYCCTDGWTVKRSIFDKTGLFDENLYLHQDTALFIKFAALGRMFPGSLGKPIAMRRMHENNRITAVRTPKERYKSLLLMWVTLWIWGKKKINSSRQHIILNRLMHHIFHYKVEQKIGKIQQITRLLDLCRNYPILLSDRYFWQRLFKSNIQE